MSADNGIYIAEFNDGWRVVHAMAIDNLTYFEVGSAEEKNEWKSYFSNSKLFNCIKSAKEEASRLFEYHTQDGWPVEYGIYNLGRGIDWK